MKLFLPITICFFPLIGLCQEAVTDTIALPALATTDVPKEVIWNGLCPRYGSLIAKTSKVLST